MVEKASRRRIGELKVNGTVCGNAVSLPGSVRNRYRIPLDTQPPRNEREGGRDAIRKSMEFGHPLVTLWSKLFYFLGVAPRPLCFPPPCRAASVLHPFCSTRPSENFIFYSFSFFFFSILTMPTSRGGRDFFYRFEIIRRNGKFGWGKGCGMNH